MKKVILLLVFSFLALSGYAQKLSIDTDLLSDLVVSKQEEIKKKVIANLVVNNIRTTNYTTYNTIYYLVDILTSEKNKTIMTKKIIQRAADYSIVYALAYYFVEQNKSFFTNSIAPANEDLYSLLSSDHSLKNDIESEVKAKNISANNKFNTNVTVPKTFGSGTKIESEDLTSADLTNAVIDNIYTLLSENDILKDKGFFNIDNERPFFDQGLDFDYDKITTSDHYKKNILPELKKLITKITKSANAIGKVTVKENGIDTQKDIADLLKVDFKDFQNITKNDILLLKGFFQFSYEKFKEKYGSNSFIATIGDLISKYIIIDFSNVANAPVDPERIFSSFKIDVESIILELEDKFFNNNKTNISNISRRWLGVKPFFTIGINYGRFYSKNSFFDFKPNERLPQFVFAGEKIGFKVIFADYKYARSFKPREWFLYRGKQRRWMEPIKKPLLNNIYWSFYGSGLIYNIVDLRSENDFKYPLVGTGLGVEFFNGMDVNISLCVPVVPKAHFIEDCLVNRGFINVGFDIPIFDYIRALRNKGK